MRKRLQHPNNKYVQSFQKSIREDKAPQVKSLIESFTKLIYLFEHIY